MKAGLDVEAVAQLLRVLADDADGRDGVGGAGGKGRGAVEHVVQPGEPGLVHGELRQRVLDDAVLDELGALGELAAQLGVLRDGDAAVIDDDAGAGSLETSGEGLDNGLFFAQYLSIPAFS